MDTGTPVSGQTTALLKRVFVFATHPLGIVAVIVAVVIVFLSFEAVRGGLEARGLRDSLEKAQRAAVESEGAVVAARSTQRALLEEADRLQEEIAVLNGKLGEKTKIREVVKWKTGDPIVIYKGEPVPDCADEAGPKSLDCPPVAVEVSGVTTTLETEAGTVSVVGKVLMKRTSPPPPELFEVPFSMDTEAFVARDLPKPPRWYVGPSVALQDGRAAFGAAAVGPPLRIWKVEVRPVFQAVSDAQGAVTASAALTFGLGR